MSRILHILNLVNSINLPICYAFPYKDDNPVTKQIVILPLSDVITYKSILVISIR